MMTYMYGREAGDAIRAYWATRGSTRADGGADPRNDAARELRAMSDATLDYAATQTAAGRPTMQVAIHGITLGDMIAERRRRHGSLTTLSDAALGHASLMAAGADPRWGGLRDEIESERDRRQKAARLAEACANGFAEMHDTAAWTPHRNEHEV